MNGLSIDHFKSGATGPLSWITKGKIDLDLHLLIPQITPSDDLLALIRSEIDGLTDTALGQIQKMVENHPEREAIRDLAQRTARFRHYGTRHPQVSLGSSDPPVLPVPEKGYPLLYMFWTVKMNELKASVPLNAPELSYMHSALIRPVVAYMNANKTSLEFSFDAKMDIVISKKREN